MHARIQKIFSGGGVQIPRRGLTENFSMAKTNNLAIPGGGPAPLSPPSGSAHVMVGNPKVSKSYFRQNRNYKVLTSEL